MDSLTQIVLGAAVGEAVLGKKIGNRAMLWGAVAGTIPDLDIVWRYLTDTITATEMHRGFSHSIVFSILAAPLLGWLVHQLKKRSDVGWQGWSKLFFWGLFTHPLLDAFTTWGTQIFWPFNWRVAFNSIFVIDPLYTVPFLICVLIAATRKCGTLSRKRTNNLGIYISTAYLLLTVVIKYIAHQKVVQNLEQQQIAYTQISTRPAPMNTVLWNINVDAGENYLIGDYSLLDSKPITFKAYPKKRSESEALINTSEVQRLITISEGWYILERNQNEWIYNDLRFGLITIDPDNPQFVFRYMLEENNGTITATEDRPDTSNMDAVLGNLWTRIKGN
ncbi:metal-dependent hydrolase [Dokdonia sp. 4H-3-7-5]|uniref:metal-dependent hydrolase n=1 Tax=Dokdonia sp. (strain 4H-3-7-5) TaxID=983548 RepID=UPI00020A6290|nr:metal-dependent hydrolase [Dokdonia sp. 4H-3-7-5]AEE18874.1 membrane-bound metal-dependent hydrolase [Dokdonia sp. 4H-3-7-5]